MSNYLPLSVRKVLHETGWLDNEIVVYSSLLEKGAMDLTTISQETGIGISTIQYAIKQLLAKKMLAKTMTNGKPRYTVSDIDSLKKWVQDYIGQFQKYQSAIDLFVDQYDFDPKTFTSKVRFYEGYKGVKQSYRQMLKDCEDKEICAFFSVIEDVGEELQNFFVDEYVPKRAEMGINIKNIALDSPKTSMYQLNGKKFLSEIKVISREHFPALNTELNIYGDYIHFMSFDNHTAFAVIINDPQLSLILKSVFSILWTQTEHIYMTDNTSELKKTIMNRESLYPKNLRQAWRDAKPIITKTAEGETVMRILDHEVMSNYQIPYMKKLADIVTQNGGDVLNIGYGLGLIDNEIESYRKTRKIGRHVVIENNKYIAASARKNKNLEVIEDEWQNAINRFRGDQFDGIIYDGYPLSLAEIHRDGIVFIEKIVERNLLRKNGTLTFYVDAAEKFGDDFSGYLNKLGFAFVKVEKVGITPPNRERQIWVRDHFLAPTIKYGR